MFEVISLESYFSLSAFMLLECGVEHHLQFLAKTACVCRLPFVVLLFPFKSLVSFLKILTFRIDSK